MIKKTPTAKMSAEQWLSERKTTIGGSEAAAIVGLDPYVSQYTLWQRKKGFAEEPSTSLPAAFGHFAETFVAQLFEEATGKKVRRENAIIRNTDFPFAHANIDRRITGENAGLECKTTSALNLKKFANGEYPAKFYVQCMHYMMVCGFDRMYLACLIGNSQFRVFEIERDEKEIEALAAAEKEFFELLQGETPPEITALDADTQLLTALYPNSNGETIRLFDRDDIFAALSKATERRKQAEQECMRLQNIIKQDLGENETGTTDSYRCSWRLQTRTTVDVEKLFADYPEIDKAAYTRTTTSRVFRFSKIQGKEE